MLRLSFAGWSWVHETRIIDGYPQAAYYHRVRVRWLGLLWWTPFVRKQTSPTKHVQRRISALRNPNVKHDCCRPGEEPTCGGTFECSDCHQDVGWCYGGSDDHRCNDCWVRVYN